MAARAELAWCIFLVFAVKRNTKEKLRIALIRLTKIS
jgi:hypothetical protein